MKKVLFFLMLVTSSLFGQGIYFSEPTSGEHIPMNLGGQAGISYSFFHENGITVSTYFARITYPDASKSLWQLG